MGQVSLTVSEPLPLDDYDEVAATGSFLLIDPQAGDTLAAGLVGRPLVARPPSTGALSGAAASSDGASTAWDAAEACFARSVSSPR